MMTPFRFVPLLLFALCSSLYADAQRPPNVLFLAVDDMKDWVNCLGGYEGTVHTPHIDRLAARGTLFTNAHCPSPKCAPSRAAIMTGLRPSTTGLYDNGHWWYPNYPDVSTIPAHFRNNKYHVAGAGKIFHHTAGNHPPNQWDHHLKLTFRNDPWFRGVKLNYPWSKHSPYPESFPFSTVKGLGHENDWGSLPIPESEYDDTLSADFAINFLQDYYKPITDDCPLASGASPPPLFLACGIFRPHLPWYVPQEYFDLYPLDDIVLPTINEDDLDDVPSAGKKLAKARRSDFEKIKAAGRWKPGGRAYLASISYADAQLGRVLDALDKSGQADKTIVVLWSDHGWHLGEKNHWHKTTLWEEATRVPFIISAPGYKPAKCARAVSLVDLFPTLNELCGLPAIDSHDGQSLVTLLRDPVEKWRPAVIEYKKGNAAVRSRKYRYIRYKDGEEELYDLYEDPNEWRNLAGDPAHKETKLDLARWLPEKWAESAPTKGAFEFDPDKFTWTEKSTGRVIDGKSRHPTSKP